MTEDEKNQAAAYIKLQDDVKQLVKEALVTILTAHDQDVIKRIQDVVIYNQPFEVRVKQIITNQMQRITNQMQR